jgi:hypothetical protein
MKSIILNHFSGQKNLLENLYPIREVKAIPERKPALKIKNFLLFTFYLFMSISTSESFLE